MNILSALSAFKHTTLRRVSCPRVVLVLQHGITNTSSVDVIETALNTHKNKSLKTYWFVLQSVVSLALPQENDVGGKVETACCDIVLCQPLDNTGSDNVNDN